MIRPTHTKPDANQKEIEQQLQHLGFWTYRTANGSPQTNAVTSNVFHPLDLLVAGVNRHTDKVELTLWEIKSAPDASFTPSEEQFIYEIDHWFARHTPILVAYDLDDILDFYGWLDRQN